MEIFIRQLPSYLLLPDVIEMEQQVINTFSIIKMQLIGFSDKYGLLCDSHIC